MTKQTRITFESESLLILSGAHSRRGFCSACGVEVDVIAMEHTGMVTNLDQPALEEWFASGDLYQIESTNGSRLICLKSLLGRLHGPRPR